MIAHGGRVRKEGKERLEMTHHATSVSAAAGLFQHRKSENHMLLLLLLLCSALS